jgi:hypothetical protein
MAEKKSYVQINFAVRKENIRVFREAYTLILELVSQGREVPAALALSLLHLLEPPRTIAAGDGVAATIRDISIVADRIERWGYGFTGTYGGDPQDDFDDPFYPFEQFPLNTYCARQMCQTVILAAKETVHANKGDAVRYIYTAIRGYAESMAPEDREHLTHYKITSMATLIANQLGHIKRRIGNDRPPSVFYRKGSDDTEQLNPDRKKRKRRTT